MLVLGRKPQETILIDGRIRVTVVEVRGNQVRLGIDAPQDVPIVRQELTLSNPHSVRRQLASQAVDGGFELADKCVSLFAPTADDDAVTTSL